MKEDPMQDVHDRDAWLGPMLRQSMPAGSQDCVDADTLAAWSDGTLDPGEAAEVERHASKCSRCMALVASMARTMPPPMEAQPERAWVFGPMLRWLVPLTAAATAIAIWVLVPNRPVPSFERTAQRQADAPAPSVVERPAPGPAERGGTGAVEKSAPGAVEPQAQPAPAQPERAAEADSLAPESPSGNASAMRPSAPETLLSREAAKQGVPEAARRDSPTRDQAREERAAIDTFAPAVESLRDRAPAPPPSSLPPAGPPLPPPSVAAPVAPAAPAAAGAVNESTVARFNQQQAPGGIVPTSESTSPTDALVQWRVFGWVAVERSIDGGKTWIKAAPPPGVMPNNPPTLWIVSIRAVDNLRAVVLMTDRREFYTTNGGLSWERVQGNSAAPF